MLKGKDNGQTVIKQLDIEFDSSTSTTGQGVKNLNLRTANLY